MGLIIHSHVREKLTNKHKVQEIEILDCFTNREKGFLEDLKEDHKRSPPRQWFIAETDRGRILQVVFCFEGVDVCIITAFEPNGKAISTYAEKATT